MQNLLSLFCNILKFCSKIWIDKWCRVYNTNTRIILKLLVEKHRTTILLSPQNSITNANVQSLTIFFFRCGQKISTFGVPNFYQELIIQPQSSLSSFEVTQNWSKLPTNSKEPKSWTLWSIVKSRNFLGYFDRT